MDIILPRANEPGRKGGLVALLVLLACAAAGVAGALAFLRADNLPVVEEAEDAATAAYRQKIQALEIEIEKSREAMFDAEQFGDRVRYLEAVRAAAAKNAEADAQWQSWQEKERVRGAAAEGMKRAVTGEDPPNRFTNAQRLEMIAQEHDLKPEDLQKIKTEIEVVFEDEYLDKFGVLPAEEPSQ